VIISSANTIFQLIETIRKNKNIFFWCVLILFIIPIGMYRIFSVDTWWHLQIGRSILENMSCPDFSSYYFTPINQGAHDLRITWLGDIILYLIHFMSGDIGLQIFRMIIIVGTCLLLVSIIRWRHNGWHLIILMMLVVGIYQKLLLRNSIFSILFTGLIFWSWWQIRNQDKNRLIWIYPVILGIWGCIHGSYLLGFGLMFLLFAGDWIDSIRGLNTGKNRMTNSLVAVTVLSFFVISINNPTTARYYNIKNIKDLFADNYSNVGVINKINDKKSSTLKIKNTYAASIQIPGLSLKAPYISADFLKASSFFIQLKEILNSTIFKTSNRAAVSGDFVSPFDHLEFIYIWVALAFGLLGLVWIFGFIRPIRLSFVLPFLAVLLIGCGYMRLIGYIPIVVSFIIFMTNDNNKLKPFLPQSVPWALSCIVLILLYANVLTGYKIHVGSKLHTVGLGAVPTFSSKLPKIILDQYPEKKFFTTLTTGGYLLYNWFPKKRVFIDAYFAPHTKEVMQDYLNVVAVENADPDSLYKKYGIEGAVVEISTGQSNLNFFNSLNWYPTMMDSGLIFYQYFPDYDADIPIPTILVKDKDLRFLSYWHKERIANFVYRIPHVLLSKGRLKDTVEFLKQNKELLTNIAQYVDKGWLKSVGNVLKKGLQEFDVINHKAIGYEIKHRAAMETNDIEDAIQYGEKVLELKDDRYSIALNLAYLYTERKQCKKSLSVLDKIFGHYSGGNEPDNDIKLKAIKLYKKLYEFEKVRGDYFSAYEIITKVLKVNKDKEISDEIYRSCVGLVELMNKSKEPELAYKLLRRMEMDFLSNGRILNDIAWHIVQYRNELLIEMNTAKTYALRAVNKMEKEKDPWLDLVYDTLAEISYVSKDYKSMKKFEEKARNSAPEERKQNYKNRQIPNVE
jgi:tetratricopeptide (TPR) repeat protein